MYGNGPTSGPEGRTQSIRTAATLEIEVALVDVEADPLYQRIASRANQLHELGLSAPAIARRLRVDPETVRKAVRWWRSWTE
jgi:hypothetical protein